tara:strand:- start:2497 stop:2625 length:129 start_codon:yes stop_codon:yes gene_type:complete
METELEERLDRATEDYEARVEYEGLTLKERSQLNRKLRYQRA